MLWPWAISASRPPVRRRQAFRGSAKPPLRPRRRAVNGGLSPVNAGGRRTDVHSTTSSLSPRRRPDIHSIGKIGIIATLLPPRRRTFRMPTRRASPFVKRTCRPNLRFESLESRSLLAADVAAGVIGDPYAAGDAAVDDVCAYEVVADAETTAFESTAPPVASALSNASPVAADTSSIFSLACVASQAIAPTLSTAESPHPIFKPRHVAFTR